MTFNLRPSEARGHANHGWLDSYHTFSFAHYYDPLHMGYRSLRVINDDVIQAGAGFPTHGHNDMEIVSYVVRGALAHKDSTGSEGILRRGDVQSMSAGTGVRHSEYNGSSDSDARLLQIWIMPEKEGLAPTYSQTNISQEEKHNKLRLLVAPESQGAPLAVHQDALIYASLLDKDASITHTLGKGRGAWIQVVDGALDVDGESMKMGDGAIVEDTRHIRITAKDASEFLLFDLA